MRRSALLLAVVGMLLIGVVPTGAATTPWEAEGDASLVGCLDTDSVDPATFSMTLRNPAADWNDPIYVMYVEIRFQNRSNPSDRLLVNTDLAYGETGSWSHDVYASSLGPAPDVVDQWRNYIVAVQIYWYDGGTRLGSDFMQWGDGYWWIPPCEVDTDGDGVMDADDMCPWTVLADPPEKLKKNRFAADAAGLFVDMNGTESGFSVIDTYGCGEDQIIDMMGLGNAHARFGITRSALLTFIATYAD